MTKQREEALKYLKMARGQIDGIIKMIENERYCIDVSNQISASTAILKKANALIIEGHLSSCIKEAILTDNMEEKLKELSDLLVKVIK